MSTCKGCREVTRLVGEVEDLRQMMESMKRIVTGRGLEEKGEETGGRMAELGEAEKCEEVITPDNSTEGNRNAPIREEPGWSSGKRAGFERR